MGRREGRGLSEEGQVESSLEGFGPIPVQSQLSIKVKYRSLLVFPKTKQNLSFNFLESDGLPVRD